MAWIYLSFTRVMIHCVLFIVEKELFMETSLSIVTGYFSETST